jgi:PIN domain nuclease of toxin-antitoxin system
MHRDPADRFIALVTADERLLGIGNIQTLANR